MPLPGIILLVTAGLVSVIAVPDDAFSDNGTFTVRQFGAKGDGVTDDTAAVQKAIDAAGDSGGTLLFPPGTYIVTSVGLRPGVRYLGYGATIKRPAKQGKWIRTFNAAKPGYQYSSDKDSPPMIIEGLTFDGNRTEQGDYTEYQLEQAHQLFLSADPKRAGRLRVRILNCQFQNAVADAISTYTNVDVQISNCTARDCFRGGITITGGYSRLQVVNFTAQGKVHPTGIDVEVDGAGHGQSKKIELTLNGISLPDGDFDLGVSDGSIVLGTNIVARAPFHLYAHNSTVRISNSEFGIGRFSGFANRIVHPGNVVFQNCRFRIEGTSDRTKAGKWAAIHVYWNLSQGHEKDQSLTLRDCEFELGPGIAEQDTTYAVYCEADRPDRNNRLLIDGGRIGRTRTIASPAEARSDGQIPSQDHSQAAASLDPTAQPDRAVPFDYGVFINLGGTIQLRNLDIAAVTPMHLGLSDNWPLDVVIDGVRIDDADRYAIIPSHGLGSRITHRNVVIDETANIITTRYGITKNNYRGRRVILGSKPPTAQTHGLLGDLYRLKTPAVGAVYEWLCLQSGCGSGAIWKPLVKIAPNGQK